MSKPTKRKPPSRQGKKVERKPGYLSPMERRFVPEYLICNNAGEAARRAGSKAANPHKVGYNLLQRPAVIAALEAERAKLASKLEITAERVLEEIARIAFSRMTDFAEWGGGRVTLKPSSGLTEAQAAAVAEVTEIQTKQGGSVKIKLHSKPDALAMLCKHLGITPETLNVSADVRTSAGPDLSKVASEQIFKVAEWLVESQS